MQTRQLGPLRVSAIGLGCMGMTPIYGQLDEGERAVRRSAANLMRAGGEGRDRKELALTKLLHQPEHPKAG